MLQILTGALPYSQEDALQLAAKKGLTDILRLLVERGVDVNLMGDGQVAVLQQAAENGHEGAVRLLLNEGAHPDRARLKGGSTPPHLAVMDGHAAEMWLLTTRAYIDGTDNVRQTALRWACLLGHEEAVDIRLEAGASVLLQDSDS